jgi:hypothetical protein
MNVTLRRVISFVLVATFCVGVALISGHRSAPSASANLVIWGDVDCSGDIAPRDTQAILKNVLGQNALSQTQPCPAVGSQVTVVVAGDEVISQIWGDVDCGGDIAPRDAQAILKNVLGQNALSQTQPCPAVGDTVTLGAGSSPTPTPAPTVTPGPTDTPGCPVSVNRGSGATLNVTVSDLPVGTTGSVTVTGPGNYRCSQTQSSIFTELIPGTYSVSAEAVHADGNTYVPKVTGSPVTLAPGATASVQVSYFDAVSDQTKTIPPSGVLGVSGLPGGPQVVTLSTTGIPALAVGDIIVIGVTPATPDGLLGKVTSIVTNGTTATVGIVPGSLLEAFPRGSFSVEPTLSPSPVSSSGSLSTASSVQVSQSVAAATAPSKVALPPILKELTCTSLNSAQVQGGVDLAVDPTFSATWGDTLLSGISRATVKATFTETATLSVTATAGAECTLPEVSLLPQAIRFAPITVPIAGFPVVIVPQLHLYLSAEASAEVSATASATQQLTATAGLQYTNGQVSPISQLTHTFTYSTPDSPDVKVSLHAAVRPELAFLLYGVAGPEASITAGLGLEVAPPPCWVLSADVAAGAGLIAPSLNLNFSNPSIIGPFTTPLLTHSCIKLDPDNGPSGTTVNVTGHDFGPGEGVTLDFDGVVVGSPGTADSNGDLNMSFVVPAADPGAHTVTATGATGGPLHTTSADFTVAPPATCTGICAIAGNGIVTLSWPDCGFGCGIYPGSPSNYIVATYFNGVFAGFYYAIESPPATILNGQVYVVIVPANACLNLSFTCGVGTTVSFQYAIETYINCDTVFGCTSTLGPFSAFSNTVVVR